jgi:hypothetical protein
MKNILAACQHAGLLQCRGTRKSAKYTQLPCWKFNLAQKKFRIKWHRPGNIESSPDEKPLVHTNVFVVAGVGGGGAMRGGVGLFHCE